jgi:CheY-like chemotaxis protein
VIDDNADVAYGLVRLLRLSGHEVQVADDGPGGLHTAKDFRPQFVVLDIGLPGMDGLGVARALRSEGFADLKVIGASGYARVMGDEDMRAAGFDYWLVKPIDFDALESILGGRMPEVPRGTSQ